MIFLYDVHNKKLLAIFVCVEKSFVGGGLLSYFSHSNNFVHDTAGFVCKVSGFLPIISAGDEIRDERNKLVTEKTLFLLLSLRPTCGDLENNKVFYCRKTRCRGSLVYDKYSDTRRGKRNHVNCLKNRTGRT